MAKIPSFDLIVIGAGPAGLTAASAAGATGAKVLVLEHGETAAKKVLSTGNGRCNYTNRVQGEACYRGSHPAFVLPALKQMNSQELSDYFRTCLKIHTSERDGYCYPRSHQASTVREALIAYAKECGVRIFTEVSIREIIRENGFLVHTRNGSFQAPALVLACGGMAAPKSGSDGSGYAYAEALGHTLIRPMPALVPMICWERWLSMTSGVRAWGTVKLIVNGECAASDTGEIQFTDYGISGIPVFQVSRFASRAVEAKANVTAEIDFLPEFSAEEAEALFAGIEDPIEGRSKKVTADLEAVLNGLVNQKITKMLLHESNRLHVTPAALLKKTVLHVTGTQGFDKAQVTCGGIDTEEVDPSTMESRLVPGLYFAGEILDVDGICGGYNLHWAFASGALAGRSAVSHRG